MVFRDMAMLERQVPAELSRRPGGDDHSRLARRLSKQDEAFVRAGLRHLSSPWRALWAVSVSGWKSPGYGEMSEPLPLWGAWVARAALGALVTDIRRQLAAPGIDEDDEVFLMNDLHSIQVTRKNNLPMSVFAHFFP
jgi:hypothetical protein